VEEVAVVVGDEQRNGMTQLALKKMLEGEGSDFFALMVRVESAL
jgi:hypothetical protein